MNKYDKNYEVMRLRLDDSGLICNSNFEVLQNSEIIAVQDIDTMKFVDYFVVNYYKAPTDEVWRNKFFNEAFEGMSQDSEHLYVRFNADDVITSNHLCVNKCVPKNIVEVISTYKAVLNVMNNIKATYIQPPWYKLYTEGYYVEDGSFTLQDGSGDFSLAIDLEYCNFYLSEKCLEDSPDYIKWKIYWCSEKEYENTLLSLYKDEDFVLYLTNPSAWYDKHNK